MSLSLALLGTFDVRCDGQPVSDFRAQSVRALLAYLAIESDRPHEREHLSALLWPDEPIQAALASLRQALHRLRQALEPEGREGHYLIVTRQSVQLNAAALQLDTVVFREALQAVAAHRHRSEASCEICAARLHSALSLYRGDLLPGFSFPESERFEEWLLIERERLHRQLFGLLDRLAVYHERRGEFTTAIELLRRWVAVEPWHEPAHLRLITALAYAGQRTLALRQFERYRSFLAADLDMEPGPAARALIAQVRAGIITPPPVPALRHAPGDSTSFIGRTQEIARLTAQLGDPACRLLTLTGMGGTGKTRLATAVARATCHIFADGAVFVSLAAIDHAEHVPEALSAALGLSAPAERPLLDQLIDELHGRDLLLLLDNCEQVAELGPLVARLLVGAPRLTILATSRVALNLRAEWIVPVEGLELADSHAVAPYPSSYTAGQLFLQVARQVRPEFSPGPAESRLVRECCEILNGSPLAIELAAAQLGALPLDRIVAMVRTSLDSLATTMSDVPLRHRSLRAVFDWSWRLLTPAERHALAHLSVFTGGCDAAAAEAVAGATVSLDQLVARSLLRHDDAGRYTMHEQIRQFAEEQLARLGTAALALERHCTYYLSMAAAQEGQINGPRAGAIIAALQADHDNLRHAWNRAMDGARYELIGSAAPVLGQIYARSDLHEGVAQFRGLLARLQPHTAAAAQARQRLLDILMSQLRAIGRSDETEPYAAELLALAQVGADRVGEAVAQLHLGYLAAHRRDFVGAWEHLRAASQLSADDRSRRGRVIHAHTLLKCAGLIDWQQLPVDRSYAEQAYTIYCEIDMPYYAGAALNRLGNQHRRCGDYGRSLTARRQALAILEGQGDLDLYTMVLNDTGEIFMLLGDYQQARAVFEQALAITCRIGLRKMEVVILEGLGRCLFHLGEIDRAEARLQQAIALDDDQPSQAHRGYFLTTMGYIAERSRNWDVAARHYAEAASWWEASNHRSDAAVEPRAGLARIALAHHQPRVALAHIEMVLPYLEGRQLQDALEPMWVHQSCYEALAAAGDRRADLVLRRARDLLGAQAAQISDPELRARFLENVAAHRAILGAGQGYERGVAA